MRRGLTILLIISFVFLMAIGSLGCKEEVASVEEEEEVASVEEEEEVESVEEEAADVMSEDEWISTLKDKWQGEALDVVTTGVIDSPNVVKEFSEITGAEVNTLTVAWPDLTPKYVATLSANSGEGMDIFVIFEHDTPVFSQNNWYVPLQDLIVDEMDDVMNSYTDMFTAKNGDLIGMPVFNSPFVLVYNERILKDGGYDSPPKTWDELKSVSMDLQKKGLVEYGITWPLFSGDDMCIDMYGCMVLNMGGEYIGEDGTPLYNNESGKRALDYLTDSIYVDKWASPTSIECEKLESLQPFLRGDNAFNFNWSVMLGYIDDPEKSVVMGETKTYTVPTSEGDTGVTWGNACSFVINPNSDNVDLAKDYLKFLALRKNSLENYLTATWMPMWSSFYNDPSVLEAAPEVADSLAILETCIARPAGTWYSEAMEILRMSLSKGWNQDTSNQEALDEAESKMKDRVEDNWE